MVGNEAVNLNHTNKLEKDFQKWIIFQVINESLSSNFKKQDGKKNLDSENVFKKERI